ncbi:MAG: hypothetical protein WB992_20255 [Bryobacteraceae bacterium]
MTRNTFLTLVFATAVTAVPAFSGTPAIGVASAVADFSVDNAVVTGNANIFEGTEVRTTVAPTDLRLENGAAVRLATRSAGIVYNDRLILQQGAVRITNFDSYPVNASQLHIQADSPNTEAVVRMAGKMIEIASLGGTVSVTDGGAMLTRVAAGTKMAFQNSGQTGAAPGQPPSQTGAAPAPEKGPLSDKKTFYWSAGICAVGAAVVGGIAASQGKNPFGK